MKNPIKIFVAGPIELKEPFDMVKKVACEIEKEYEQYNKRIRIEICSCMNLGYRQDVCIDFIENKADIVLFILDKGMSEWTKMEYRLAEDMYRLNNHPKVLVFLNEYSLKTPEINHIEEMMSKYGSYYSIYKDPNDLKEKLAQRMRVFIDDRIRGSENIYGKLIDKLKSVLTSIPKNEESVSLPERETREIKVDSDYFAFISYSRKDLKIAKMIKKDIETFSDSRCWMDMEGIESGTLDFEEVIISAIEKSKIVIFLMSENSMSSDNTKEEIRYARSLKKRIVHINIDNSDLSGWYLYKLKATDIIDCHNSDQMEKLFSDIMKWSESFRKKENSNDEKED